MIAVVAFVLAALALASPAAAAPFAKFSLCYKINGLASQNLDDPFAIAVSLSGYYNTTLLTSTATKYTPAGTYYVLYNITSGNRTTLTRNGITVTVGVKSLVAPNGFDFNDNWLFIGNTSQWVDDNGIAYNLKSSTEFPGKRFGSQVNLYRDNVYGPVFETVTGGTNTSAATQQFYVDGVTGWTGPTYTPGVCKPDALTSVPVTPNTFNNTKQYAAHINYHLASTVKDTEQFTIDASVVLTSQPFATGNIDTFGDQYLTLPSASTAGASGWRLYCYGTTPTCINSTINGTAPTGAYGFADNQLYAYFPYLSYNGPAYELAAPVPKPGYTNTNYTDTVNIYFSQGGEFLEGFGVGGTGPSGSFNYSLTRYTLTYKQL